MSKILKYTILFAFLFRMSYEANCQDSIATKKMQQNVLKSRQIGRKFHFNISKTQSEKNLAEITYLGTLHTNKHTIYKILTWATVWGPNAHTTGVILLFGINNKYVGKYILGAKTDLPSKIEKNSLVFSNKDKLNCDPSLSTKISFCKGIPNDLFIKCKGDTGDIYSFDDSPE